MNKREFLKNAAILTSASVLPTSIWAYAKSDKLRTAHIGVGGMGMEEIGRAHV